MLQQTHLQEAYQGPLLAGCRWQRVRCTEFFEAPLAAAMQDRQCWHMPGNVVNGCI